MLRKCLQPKTDLIAMRLTNDFRDFYYQDAKILILEFMYIHIHIHIYTMYVWQVWQQRTKVVLRTKEDVCMQVCACVYVYYCAFYLRILFLDQHFYSLQSSVRPTPECAFIQAKRSLRVRLRTKTSTNRERAKATERLRDRVRESATKCVRASSLPADVFCTRRVRDNHAELTCLLAVVAALVVDVVVLVVLVLTLISIQTSLLLALTNKKAHIHISIRLCKRAVLCAFMYMRVNMAV